MRKFMPGLLVLSILLLGCALNRNGSYTRRIFKTTNNRIGVSGTVYNIREGRSPISKAGIKSTDTTLITVTGLEGKYKIELPEGKHIIRATYLGYKLASTKYLKLVKGDSVVLDFMLKKSFEKTIN